MCLTKNCAIYLFGKIMKSTQTYIFSSWQDSQLNWAKQYKHADPLRIGAKEHFFEPYYSSYEKYKYNKQLKPNCINLVLRLKLETKTYYIIDLLHREFHKDSKKSTFAILRLFYELLWISKVHPEICTKKR